MGKNIKEIVEEGFARLSSLGEKRSEILNRCRSIASTGSPEFAQAGEKLKEAEAGYLAEINTQVAGLLSEMRKILAQVEENSLFFQGEIKETLVRHLTGHLAEMNNTRDYMLKGSSERLDSIFSQTEREFKAHENAASSESQKLLGELNAICQASHSGVIQSQAAIAGKLSQNQDSFRMLLSEAYATFVQSAEKKRQLALEKMSQSGRQQSDELARAVANLDSLVASLVTASIAGLKADCQKLEESLSERRAEILEPCRGGLEEASREALSQLQSDYERCHGEISAQTADLLETAKNTLELEKKSLADLDGTFRSNAETFCKELSSGAADSVPGSRRNPVEEAFTQAGDEMNLAAEDLKRKLKALLDAQSDALSKLCAGAEKSFLDLFDDFKAQLQESMKAHDQLCDQKESHLKIQLSKLEKQILEMQAELGASGGAKK